MRRVFTMLLGTMLLGLSTFFVGCGQSAKDTTNAESAPSSPSELVASLISESEEFSFCLSEGAGPYSFKECTGRMQDILAALPDTVSVSDLSPSKKQTLNAGMEKLKAAYSELANSVESNAGTGVMTKANKKFRKEVERISKNTH